MPKGNLEHDTRNSRDDSSSEMMTAQAGRQLRTVIERIERLMADKASVQDDIKEVFAEAKANGFDSKIIRLAIKRRGMDKVKRDEEDALLDLYLSAIGGEDAL